MPERTIDTEIWVDDFVQNLTPLSKLLFVYLWTNPNCNQAGLYHITLKTVAFDTGIPEKDLPDLLKSLKPKVEWSPNLNLIWVKNFVKRQYKSPDFLIAVGKCLPKVQQTEVVQKFLAYNLETYGLKIPLPEEKKSQTQPKTHKEPESIDPVLAGMVQCYEENIGILTPMLFEQLRDFREQYPKGWFEEAVKEATLQNKRNTKYIEAILKRWQAEGKDAGTHRQVSTKGEKGFDATRPLR